MDLRHLKMIQEVARQGNLTKAAESIYLSQSALSHQLKDVEAFFNTQIFIRQKKQMLLTNTGKIILEASERITGEIEQTKNRIKFLSEKNAGEIKIATECYTSYHWLSSFLKEYKALYPKVEVNIDTGSTYNSVSALLENKIDIAIVEDNRNTKLNYIPLFRDEFVAIVPSEHDWAALKWVDPEMFFSESYLMYTIPNEISTIYKLLFKNGKPQKVIKIALTEVIIQMVKAGMGVTVLPHWVASSWLQSGELTAVPITKKGIKRNWYAATLKNKELPQFMYVFMRNLSKHLKHSDQLAMLEFN
jgi:LysR family transcriptional regulator, regulator for metE and metH